ncbi:WD40 repeat domain-containing serine/threonine protein kinase [Aquisphaera insulae]|uniref:WD40 repeat domain-containing serine/threonine protein kinase n=1 Tax=Aquisphaera insulae TaxID=2712864 RepID=UPI0013ED1324|nr:serine/threonine-protein kinase [Aquisphaera insulae]
MSPDPRERAAEEPDPQGTVAYVGPMPGGVGRGGHADETLARGDVSAGDSRFQIVRLHARGGLGEVYLADDPRLRRQVALKAIQPRFAHDPVSQARFVQEAEVTAGLEHPGIVPVYGIGRESDGRPFYVMRFIEGETLKAAIARFHSSRTQRLPAAERELTFRRLLQALVAACNAVAYAHSRGVVHRDIKPDNIMLGPFGETLVVDWGIAKTHRESLGPAALTQQVIPFEPTDEGLTQPGSAVGTPRYMSPEQATGDLEQVGAASDLYGLGATFYCLLVGRGPFPDGELSDILDRVRRGIFPSPRSVRRNVDPTLEAICLKAMSLRPEDRHASPLELAGEIEAWLADVRYRGDQARAFNEVKASLVRLCIERAHNLLGRARHDEGMLWLSRALENLPADSSALERVVRSSLGAWHARDKLLERSIPHGKAILAIAFGPDGRRLATAARDGSARIWDVATAQVLAQVNAHAGPIAAIAFSPDGSRMATAGADGTSRFWDALSGDPIGAPMRHSGPVSQLRFSQDGAWVATWSRGGPACLWDLTRGRASEMTELGSRPAVAFAFSMAPIEGDPLIATAHEDGGVMAWDPGAMRPSGRPMEHPGPITAMAFRPGTVELLTACRDGKARLWDLRDSRVVREITLQSAVKLVGFDVSGRVAAFTFEDGTGRLWEAGRGLPIGETIMHAGPISDLAFSPDGTFLATCGGDRTARLWDTSTGLPVGPPLDHPDAVTSLGFSLDGRRLVTASADGLARLWRVAPQIPGDVERVGCWIRTLTGLDFDAGDAISRLDPDVGWELRRRLNELGGPPIRKVERW